MKNVLLNRFSCLRDEIKQSIQNWRMQGLSEEEIQKKIDIMRAHFCVFLSDESVFNEILEAALSNKNIDADKVCQFDTRLKETKSNICGTAACVTRH